MYEQYDKILPNNSNKIVRKLDKSAKVEPLQIEGINNEFLNERLGIVITEKMRQSVKGGQPLFSVAGPMVAGASGAGAIMANQEGASDGNTN
jgi:hypothetical protein